MTRRGYIYLHNGRSWYLSSHTGYWFLYGVGFVVEENGYWVAGLSCRKIKPKRKKFSEQEEAMSWVEEKGGQPWRKKKVNF